MAKYHFLTGDDLDALPLDERVARCVEIKAAFVAADEREELGLGGAQVAALLNYGHTLAHALEIATAHALTHGEAVGIGLVYAAELAAALERIDAGRVAAHRAVVGGTYGLPMTIPEGVDDRSTAGADGAGQEGPRWLDVRARRTARRGGRRADRSGRGRRRAGGGALSGIGTVDARATGPPRVRLRWPRRRRAGRPRRPDDGPLALHEHPLAHRLRRLAGVGRARRRPAGADHRRPLRRASRRRPRRQRPPMALSAPSWRCARSGRS